MRDDLEVQVVRMTPAHFAEVIQISRKAFTNPWKEADYLDIQLLRNTVSLVAITNGEVAGFLIYERHPDFIYLVQTAVHEKYARQGVVTGLMRYLKQVLKHSKKDRIEADVPENAQHFISLVNKLGYDAIGINRDQFEDQGEPIDGYRFVYRIPLDDLLPEKKSEEYLPVE